MLMTAAVTDSGLNGPGLIPLTPTWASVSLVIELDDGACTASIGLELEAALAVAKGLNVVVPVLVSATTPLLDVVVKVPLPEMQAPAPAVQAPHDHGTLLAQQAVRHTPLAHMASSAHASPLGGWVRLPIVHKMIHEGLTMAGMR